MTSARILIGITGGIAAYKIPDLVRRLRDEGCKVRVIMTQAAKAFITPLTLQAVSGHPVHDDLFDLQAEAAMGHIELAKWATQILIAPASADVIARLAHGMANDLLTTTCLASNAPMAIAPAMNQQMWRATVTQQNIEALRARGVACFGPAAGAQACGDVGPGRMLEPTELVEAILGASDTKLLQGQRVLITAGPTREPIDPVRFISNHSSGKMGFALAEVARQLGATVTLVAGPVALQTPAGVKRIDIETAEQMQFEVQQHDCDIFIGVAAVCDWAPVATHPTKQSKSDLGNSLALTATPDILADVAARTTRPLTVGFAAQTHDVVASARAKLQQKNLDMIVANQVGVAGSGFNSDENAVDLLWGRDEQRHVPRARKHVIAQEILQQVAVLLNKVKANVTTSTS